MKTFEELRTQLLDKDIRMVEDFTDYSSKCLEDRVFLLEDRLTNIGVTLLRLLETLNGESTDKQPNTP